MPITRNFGPETATQVREFFGTAPTPLVPLKNLAQQWGLDALYIKDESQRLGQQAFKVFGGAFAMAKYIAKELGVSVHECGGIKGLKELYHESGRKRITFVTCTDGNHGRGIAWAAKEFGHKAVVYMPKGSADARVQHIREHGGECTVTDMNYDATVEFAVKQAGQHGWVLLQDTTAPGYFEIPTWIMEGYTAMADEAVEQIACLNDGVPTHIFLQCGVGSMAGAVLGYMVERCKADGSRLPVTITVEPNNAACAYESAKKGDGSMVDVEGDLDSMIAGLCCGVLSEIGWPILWSKVDGGFAKVADDVAGNGMRLLKNEGVEAGECGGAPVGLLQAIMQLEGPEAMMVRNGLGLDAKSRVLIINTEGATDQLNYDKQMKQPSRVLSGQDFDVVLRRHPDIKKGVEDMASTTKHLVAVPSSSFPSPSTLPTSKL